jgi:predicted  nucleic acid-binding Zn-ribbon protein
MLYKNSTVNYGLLQIIDNSSFKSSKPAEARDYSKDLTLAQERVTLMVQKLEDSQNRAKAVKANLETENRVLLVLEDELKFVQDHHRAQKMKVAELSNENSRLDDEIAKLKTVIDPLLIEIQKLKLLVEGTRQT